MYYKKRVSKIWASLSIAALSVVLITSCSSYDNVSSYDDGIYSNKASKNQQQTKQNVDNRTANTSTDATAKNNNQEESYFDKQAKLISQARQQTNDVFTDVDNYTSQDTTAQKSQVVYGKQQDKNYQANSYGGWGSQTSSVDINIFNNGPGWNNWGWNNWGWNNWGWNPRFYGPYRGFGFNRWMNPRFGFGFYDPFYGPGFNYGWGYNGFYGNARFWSPYIYGRNYIAYQNGYRNSLAYSNIGSRSNLFNRSPYNRSTLNERGNRSNQRRADRSNRYVRDSRSSDRNARYVRGRSANDNERYIRSDNRRPVRNSNGLDARRRSYLNNSSSSYRNVSSRNNNNSRTYRSNRPSSNSRSTRVNRSSRSSSSSSTTRSSSSRSSSGSRSSGGGSRSSSRRR
jgi:hypothetical protein